MFIIIMNAKTPDRPEMRSPDRRGRRAGLNPSPIQPGKGSSPKFNPPAGGRLKSLAMLQTAANPRGL